MFDVLQTIKDEVLDDKFIASCKDLVEKTGMQTTIVFVCNSKEPSRHLMTIATQMMNCDGWRRMIRTVACRFDCDAILTVVTTENIEGQLCMTVTVETLLNRYAMVYPYERIGQEVAWEEPRQVELPDRYGDLLPAPAGMASA